MSWPSSWMVPAVGSIRRRIGAADGGLAAAALADQTQRLAGADREADAVDGIDVADGAPQQTLAHGEVLPEVRRPRSTGVRRHLCGGASRVGLSPQPLACSASRSECQQAAQWSGCFSS